MSIFDDIIGKNADERLAEEMLYAEAMREIEKNIRRDGLWGKAIAESDGDEKKAKAEYLKLRVQALKDELENQRKAIAKVTREKEFEEKKKRTAKFVDTLGSYLWALFALLSCFFLVIFIIGMYKSPSVDMAIGGFLFFLVSFAGYYFVIKIIKALVKAIF
jgi:hypothetical protein